MSEWTTEQIRDEFAFDDILSPGGIGDLEKRAEFDRWLAAHDAAKRAEWEAEQGDKQSPCVMTHTPPFDFAQCETHDETFPLGGVCKWHGKESIYEVLEDEAYALRMRAVRAEHQLEILRAEQGETEWEYGRVGHFVADGRDAHDDAALIDRRTAEVNVRLSNDDEKDEQPTARVHYTLARRRAGSKPGPWMPVPDTTEGES